MCDNKDDCCNQLEAEAIHTNQQLLNFDVRSKDIKWHEHVIALTPRSPAVYLQRQFNLMSNYREPVGDHNRRQILVCHDMMGNYLEDRHYHSSRKYDDYRFYHWSGMDYFNYFSHNYITIPPCGWINAAHKHGVKVLGTFITEHTKGSELLHEILESEKMVNNCVEALVKLCKHYRFEGWLVNVECKVNPEAMKNLYYFVQRLRETVEQQIVNGSVFWYDSVIQTGALSWQNEINDKNLQFFSSTHGTLINYGWNDISLERTRTVCEQDGLPYEKAFFGIDIFGRGQRAQFDSKNTLARIVSRRFSTAFFAPAYVYETLQRYGYNIKQPMGTDDVNVAFLLRNEKFWWLLWDRLATHPYNAMPFYTDFCLGSGKQAYVSGLPKSAAASSAATATLTGIPDAENVDVPAKSIGRFFNLSRQSLQPSVPLHELATHYYEDAFNGGSCLRIEKSDISFRLFATDFKLPSGGLVFAYAYKLNQQDGEFDCILRFCTGNNARDCYLFLGDYYDTVSLQKGRCYVSAFKPKYNELLTGPLECSDIPKDMAFSDFAANGWRTRYYVVGFDGSIQVKDIGVLYRKTPEARDTAYLGAVYLNQFDVNSHDFPADSNIALIQVYGGDLLN